LEIILKILRGGPSSGRHPSPWGRKFTVTRLPPFPPWRGLEDAQPENQKKEKKTRKKEGKANRKTGKKGGRAEKKNQAGSPQKQGKERKASKGKSRGSAGAQVFGVGPPVEKKEIKNQVEKEGGKPPLTPTKGHYYRKERVERGGAKRGKKRFQKGGERCSRKGKSPTFLTWANNIKI